MMYLQVETVVFVTLYRWARESQPRVIGSRGGRQRLSDVRLNILRGGCMEYLHSL